MLFSKGAGHKYKTNMKEKKKKKGKKILENIVCEECDGDFLIYRLLREWRSTTYLTSSRKYPILRIYLDKKNGRFFSFKFWVAYLNKKDVCTEVIQGRLNGWKKFNYEKIAK